MIHIQICVSVFHTKIFPNVRTNGTTRSEGGGKSILQIPTLQTRDTTAAVTEKMLPSRNRTELYFIIKRYATP